MTYNVEYVLICLCRSGAPRPMCCVLFFPQFCAFCLQCLSFFPAVFMQLTLWISFVTMHIYSNVNFLYLLFSCSLCSLWGVVQFYAFLYVCLLSNHSSTVLIISWNTIYSCHDFYMPLLSHVVTYTMQICVICLWFIYKV